MTWLPITPIPVGYLDHAGRKDAELINARIDQLVEHRAAYDEFVTEFRDSKPDPLADHHAIVNTALNAEIRGRFDRYALHVAEAALRRDIAEQLTFCRKPALLDAVDDATQALGEARETVRASLEKQGWTPTADADNPGRFVPGMVEANPKVHAARNRVAELRAAAAANDDLAREHLAAAEQLDETVSIIRARLVAG
jgi:hypothetical protein